MSAKSKLLCFLLVLVIAFTSFASAAFAVVSVGDVAARISGFAALFDDSGGAAQVLAGDIDLPMGGSGGS